MRNLGWAIGVTVAVVMLIVSGAARGWVFLVVLAGGLVTIGSVSGRTPPTGEPGTGRRWRSARQVALRIGQVGRRGATTGTGRAHGLWELRRRWWRYGPNHPDASLRCAYCRHRSTTADEALDHANTHIHDYVAEVADSMPADPVTPARPSGPAYNIPEPVRPPADHVQEDDMPAQPTAPVGPFGTAGRGSVAGLVLDWESSEDARRDPDTFVAWLQAQAAGARQASTLVPDLVHQHHGRGPNGHAGVPKEILDRFAVAFAEARAAEADAYARFAAEYAGHVEQAEHELTQSYGREVLASATAAHRG